MPAIVIDKPPQRSEAMWQALKAHIIKQRQKKKQEQEADAEVERQRKERERQQKQDKMTLGETREQISQLEQRLQQLKDEKHQLFLQLKKVLNEDDNRRRQLVKESSNSDMIEMYGYPGVTLGNPQLFLQQNMQLANRNPLYKVPPSHTLLPAGTLKRRRSPSPANYPQYGTYKPATSQATYQKMDENRRGHEYVRAVLWNKPYGLTENSQYGPFYTTSTTISYSAAPTQPQPVYTTYGNPAFQTSSNPSSAQPVEPPAQPPKHHYMAQQRPHNPSYLHVTIDAKSPFPEDNFYSSAQIRPATHVPLHGGAIPIQQPPQGAKTGGITSGYPIRPPASAPTATTPHSVYVSQTSSGSRLVYSQPVTSQPSIRYSVPPMQRET
ncbi:G protein pathway suppressor 2 [Macrosteles quadrilineatus]|uniref:G protein pathway suppressor 2 n=1 Tax=Macrosteles quadrilineatus TaxID=74068 RepID=UPI0023E29EBA|nr:G protein pathway suppressor 2 [Macrosteles quadrilineatus]XP_054258082.1 G protein pathway suppressor 2 [Macrosteles quadrilineatus]